MQGSSEFFERGYEGHLDLTSTQLARNVTIQRLERLHEDECVRQQPENPAPVLEQFLGLGNTGYQPQMQSNKKGKLT